MQIDLGSGKTLEFVHGDITRQSTEAVVNAANSSLRGGGGVDGAIHRAGGPRILEECISWVSRHGTLSPGKVMHTTAGRMGAKYVLHTVGPVWHGGQQGEPELLASCYGESIRLADELQLASVAFPSISTGAYGYPVGRATQVAIGAAVAGLSGAGNLRLVRFVLFSEDDLRAYTEAAREWLKRSGTQPL